MTTSPGDHPLSGIAEEKLAALGPQVETVRKLWSDGDRQGALEALADLAMLAEVAAGAVNALVELEKAEALTEEERQRRLRTESSSQWWG